jgi:hypothetical protein
VLRDARLLFVPVILALLLLPMCLGLYQQHGIDGLRFYFWEQSFGRITGSNRWQDDSTGFFFLHTFLWVALPWTLFALVGLFSGILRRGRSLPEYASITGVVLTVIALSFSHYKLPHYLFVVMPLASVIAARALCNAHARVLDLFQFVVVLCVGAGALWLSLKSFPIDVPIWPFVLLACMLLAVVFYARSSVASRALWPSLIIGIGTALVINGHFYPALLKFQAGSQVGNKVRELKIHKDDLANLATMSRALDFHAGFSVHWLRDISEAHAAMRPGLYIYCNEEGRAALLNDGHAPTETWIFPAFPVQVLTTDFLVPERRGALVRTHYLLKF